MVSRSTQLSPEFSKLPLREKDKIGSIINLIARKSNGIFITRLMKLLFIIEEESIKDIGVPVVGLEFDVAEKGPLVVELWQLFQNQYQDFNNYISFQYNDALCGFEIKAINDPMLNRFSKYERQLIDEVIEKYKPVKTEDIIEHLHTHDGSLWKGIVEKYNIDFSKKKTSGHKIDFNEHTKNNETNQHFYDCYLATRK